MRGHGSSTNPNLEMYATQWARKIVTDESDVRDVASTSDAPCRLPCNYRGSAIRIQIRKGLLQRLDALFGNLRVLQSKLTKIAKRL